PLPLPTLTTIRRTCALSSLRRSLSTLSSRRRPGSRLRAHGALVSGSRPTPTAVRAKLIPTFVAPAKAGAPGIARMAHYVFAWIPAYAGTTTYLSQWAYAGTTKVSSVARSKQTRSQSPSLRRRPESRHLRAWRAAFLPGSRPTPGRQYLSQWAYAGTTRY